MERHEIDKFKSWNFSPPSFEELHGDDVYHSRYVLTQLTAACPTLAVSPSTYYVPLHVGLLPGAATASPLQRTGGLPDLGRAKR